MNRLETICTICPRGCRITVTKENDTYNVQGNFCKRGVDYGIKEITHPVRKLTSTVKIKGALYPRLPVVTDKELPKEMLFDVMKVLEKVEVKAPVKAGEVIIANVLNTNVNIISSRTMENVE